MTTRAGQHEAPALLVFAGPNGSGKSTITAGVLGDQSIFDGDYINADDIAAALEERFRDNLDRDIAAAELAASRRLAALTAGRAFAFETVMSTPEKVALITQAKARGYVVSLFFVTTEDALINVARVDTRVAAGGHAVPPDAVLRRYASAMLLLPAAFEHADQAVVIDNSGGPGETLVVATKYREQIDFPDTGFALDWVEQKLRAPFLRRLTSRRRCIRDAGHAVVRDPDASDGHDYTGRIVCATEHHVLQRVDSDYFLHDRQLSATVSLTPGREQTIRYRYRLGKIVPDET